MLRNVLPVLLLVLLTISQTGIVFAGTNVWTSNGPAGPPIRALAIDPVTPANLYAGTSGDGVFAIHQTAATSSIIYLPKPIIICIT